MSNNTMHPWERAGLGIAPFKYAGYEYKTYQACPGAPIQVGASCDACAQGIKHVCWIEDANGKRFKVGNVCVGKLSRENNRKLIQDVEDAVKRAKKEQQFERETARIEVAKKELAENDALRAELTSEPHPNAWRAEQGDTRLDYFTWMFENAGHSGSMQIMRAINKRLKNLAAQS